jgi:hypothetical protein
MPWMPEVFSAPIAEARRPQEAEATSTNDVVPYYESILADEPEALVRSFAAQQPVLDDPRVGYVEGAQDAPGLLRARWIPYGGSKTVKPAVLLRLSVGEDEMNIAIR